MSNQDRYKINRGDRNMSRDFDHARETLEQAKLRAQNYANIVNERTNVFDGRLDDKQFYVILRESHTEPSDRKRIVHTATPTRLDPFLIALGRVTLEMYRCDPKDAGYNWPTPMVSAASAALEAGL